MLPKVLKALEKIPIRDRRRIVRRIGALAGNPFPDGAKKLQGKKRDFFRIRSGDYRVVYQAEQERLLVLVVRVAHRREVYRA